MEATSNPDGARPHAVERYTSAPVGALVIGIAGAAFAGRAIQRPFLDGDLFWQKHLGAFVLAHGALPRALGSETFTSAGVAWTPQEWLLGIASFLAVSHGAMWILALAAGLAAAGALWLSERRCAMRGISPVAIAVALAFGAIALEGSFGVRAQVFAWPFFCALLLVLDSSGPRVLLALPVAAAWANVHASAAIATPIVWLDAMVDAARHQFRNPEMRWHILVSALVPFTILCTPLGWRLPLYAFTLVNSPIRGSIDEWQHVAWRHDFFWYGALPLLLLAVSCARTHVRERPRDAILTAGLGVMAVLAIRNVSLAGLAAIPLAARSIDVLLDRFYWWPVQFSAHVRKLVIPLTLAASAAILTFMIATKQPANTFHPPVATFAALSQRPGVHRVFCYDFAVCSIALDYPNELVFMDGRADPYPLQVWNDFNLIRFTRLGWGDRLDAYRIDAVVAKRNGPLDKGLAKIPEWKALPQIDACCLTYVRPALRAPSRT